MHVAGAEPAGVKRTALVPHGEVLGPPAGTGERKPVFMASGRLSV